MTTTAGRDELRPPERTSIRIGPSAPERACLESVGVAIAQCSRGRSSDRRLQQFDFPGVSVQPGPNSQGQRPLSGDVTNGEAVRNGDPEWAQVGCQHLIE